jgi:integrase
MTRHRIPPGMFARDQGGVPRYYARVPGRGRVALCPPGQKRATSDLDTALALYTQLAAAEQKQQLRAVHGLPPVEMTLAAGAAEHLKLKAAAGRVGRQSIAADELNLTRACAYFGADTLLEALTPQQVGAWAAHLLTTPVAPRLPKGKKRGKRKARVMGPSNARKCLNSLSNLFRRGAEQGWVSVGFNPVAALMTTPQGKAAESRWFEAHEVALLLESARTLHRKRPKVALGCAHELVATAALTGARPGELLGLRAEDVSFDRNLILIRGTKTEGAFRSVPLWPQLREILYPYLCPDERTPRTGLLFRSPKTGSRLTDVRKLLDAVATRVGFPARAVNLYAFRHSYCAARLQTLDRGAPVSPYTVGKELGHGGDALVRRVYGHLGETRHRAEAVEYRVEQHAAKLKDRLAALRIDSENDSVSVATS